MRFSENRPVAWAVLAAVILLTISLSGGKAMKDLRYEAERMFYDGNNGLSINNDLTMRANKTSLLLSVARGCLSADNANLQKVQQAYDHLTGADTIASAHQANDALTQSIEGLYTDLEKANLSETDKNNAYNAYKEIQNRAYTISVNASYYNDGASDFNKVLKGFPANLISQFTGIEPLVLFE